MQRLLADPLAVSLSVVWMGRYRSSAAGGVEAQSRNVGMGVGVGGGLEEEHRDNAEGEVRLDMLAGKRQDRACGTKQTEEQSKTTDR